MGAPASAKAFWGCCSLTAVALLHPTGSRVLHPEPDVPTALLRMIQLPLSFQSPCYETTEPEKKKKKPRMSLSPCPTTLISIQPTYPAGRHPPRC